MDDQRNRSARTAAKGAGGVLVAVIVVNVLVRVLPTPDLDLPSLSLPDLPGWAHTVGTLKRWIMFAVVATFVVCVVADELGKRRDRDRPGREDAPR